MPLIRKLSISVGVAGVIIVTAINTSQAVADSAVDELAKEVGSKGWIVFSAHAAEIEGGRIIEKPEDRGQMDLYLSRPDGSELRNITNTPDFHELGGFFSKNGTRLLYRKADKKTKINHNHWGSVGTLVIADADGSNPIVQGKDGEFPWASFGPQMKQIACLYKREGKIRFFDLKTKKPVGEISNRGFFQQMTWSPDGTRLVGAANVAGRKWNVVSIDRETEKPTLLTRALNCTPDWFQSDPSRVIYSNRNPALFPGQYKNYGLTMLMHATVDGKSRKLIYGNHNKHCYYGCMSPEDKYVLFADDPSDSIVVGEMRILRLADTPIIPPSLKTLKMLYPNSNEGPVFSLKLPGGIPLRGFEPHWTYADIGGKK